MLMQPEWVTTSMFVQTVRQVAKKGRALNLSKLRFETLDEGTCVQTLHIGSYDDEAEILQQMHDQIIPEQGLKMVKKHHEIYFSDFRKIAPSKLRTILRQPVLPKEGTQ